RRYFAPSILSGSVRVAVLRLGRERTPLKNFAQKRTDSPERSERCTRMSADVARKTAELLNLNIGTPAALEAAPVVTFKRQEPSATCYSCHGKGKKNSDVIAKMSCNECHEQAVDHSEKK
ncbi:MAG: hypothetical protein IJE77_05485, partial [Thermoguttaceae bacterium]|nr:hypothetical protein [Thermoguttaceae bacterium]